MLLTDERLTTYSHSPLPLQGAFYFFNNTRHSRKAHSIPGTMTQLHRRFLSRFYHQKSLNYFHLQQSLSSHIFNSTDTSISSTHLPHTSLPIPIMDAIGSSKSRRNLLPLFRYLIEPDIKRKRVVVLALAIFACSCSFCCNWSQPIASVSLSPSGT